VSLLKGEIIVTTPVHEPSPQLTLHQDMVWIAGGTFEMGSDKFYPEEQPVHRVSVDGFWIDRYAVTNEQYSRFVSETGYVTVAERPLDPRQYPGAPLENLVPGSMVFNPTSGPVDLRNYANWWAWTPGASWRHPTGPKSSVLGIEQHPVVQIAYEDAETYCTWAGKALATEAEWEYAARGGLEQAAFTWGDEHEPDGRPAANVWQGHFPWENLLSDGYLRTSPVGDFPPNGYDLYDMAGNVWEWTADWYLPRHPGDPAKSCCTPSNPRGGSEQDSFNPHRPQLKIPRKVVKGGSHLCAPNYCLRYRPAARQPQDIDSGMSHIGFRCVARPADRP
jgi:sulfatase modifying factor 1